jgi:glutaredoxin 3
VAKVEIYSDPFCLYCARAKKLLRERGADFEDIDVMADPRRKPEMIERSGGRRTVPQVFIDGRHIGGSDDLAAFDRDGKLAPLLAG